MTTDEMQTIVDTINALNVRLDGIQKSVESIKGEISDVKARLDAVESGLQGVRQDIVNLTKANDVMSKQIVSLTKAHEVLTVHVSESLSRVGSLEKVVHAH